MSPGRVARRAGRILGPLGTYSPVDALRRVRPTPPLVTGESVIGVYDNLPDTAEERIFVTDRSLLVFAGMRWRRLGYDAVASVGFAAGCEAGALTAVEVVEADGRRELLPVRRSTAGVPDAFAFVAFLSRVDPSEADPAPEDPWHTAWHRLTTRP